VGGLRVCGAGCGILVVHRFCAAPPGMEFYSDWSGGSGGIWGGAGNGSLGDKMVRSVRLLAHQPEFFAGEVWSVADDFEFGVRMVPMGTRASGIQPAGTTGKDFIARLLGTHRVCVWTIVDLAEGPMRIRGSIGRIGGDFPGNAGIIGSKNTVEARSASMKGHRRENVCHEPRRPQGSAKRHLDGG